MEIFQTLKTAKSELVVMDFFPRWLLLLSWRGVTKTYGSEESRILLFFCYIPYQVPNASGRDAPHSLRLFIQHL